VNDAAVPKPWYKQGYPWMLIAIPASAIVAGIATLIIAIVSYDGLVVDDYYRRGLEINRRLEREQRAVEMGIEMQAELSEGRLSLSLQAYPGEGLPSTIKVLLAHATRAGLDRELLLEQNGYGTYAADIVPLPAGYWYLQVDGPDWRLVERKHVRSR
jgi:hypothetical protein